MDKLGLFSRVGLFVLLGSSLVWCAYLDRSLVKVQKEVSTLDTVVSVLKNPPKKRGADCEEESHIIHPVRDFFVLQRF